MFSRSKYTIYHIDKEEHKKNQIESINNRKQTIKKNVQIKLENEWEVGGR